MMPMKPAWKGIDLEIPEGVKKIPPYTYHNGTELRSIRIPASVVEIGEGAFDGCVNLEDIFVAPENQHYADAFGVLCSKDGTRLIRVPENHHGVLILDYPIEVIEKNALKDSVALNVILCAEDLYPKLQDAFRVYEEVDPVPWDPEQIPDVNIIDSCGVLLDPEKTVIYSTLYPICGSYTVCDGVENIQKICAILDDTDFDEFTDITIPVSVTEIDPGAFDRCPNLTIHATAGSYAADFAKNHGIPYTVL